MPAINLNLPSPLWRPPTDVFETDQSVVIRVEIAGLREQDLKLDLSGSTLSIRGCRLDNPAGRAYHRMEIHFGEFSLEIELPANLPLGAPSAVYESGFLWLTLPRLDVVSS